MASMIKWCREGEREGERENIGRGSVCAGTFPLTSFSHACSLVYLVYALIHFISFISSPPERVLLF